MERVEYDVMAAVEAQHWWYGGMRAIAAALLDPLYARRQDLRILDAGCGTGGNALFLQRYGQVTGLDLAAEAIESAKVRMHRRCLRGSVLSLPFNDASFDLVTSFDVLYHRGVTDEVAALREAWRVLRPGGRLLLRLPAYEFLRGKHDRAVHTRRRYTAHDVQSLLRRAGFIVEHCSYINSLLFPLALAQRLLEKAVPSLEQQQSDMTLPPAVINQILRWPLMLEAAWLRLKGRFPVGLSIICLAHSGKLIHLTPCKLDAGNQRAQWHLNRNQLSMMGR
jgi:Methylase involved in ubiquinone/menaquinone biosynthesis